VHDIVHSLSIWECLAHRFNTASLAQAMNLKHTLFTLSKDENQTMEDYLWDIKQITDSLASIGLPVSNMDLVTQTLNGINEDYHILATALSYGSNFLTFDDLRAKLIHCEQRLKFLKSKSGIGFKHYALTVSYV